MYDITQNENLIWRAPTSLGFVVLSVIDMLYILLPPLFKSVARLLTQSKRWQVYLSPELTQVNT